MNKHNTLDIDKGRHVVEVNTSIYKHTNIFFFRKNKQAFVRKFTYILGF